MLAPAASGLRDPAVGGHSPPPSGAGTAIRAVLPTGCQPGGCQNSASGCNKGGELSLVGIFPCRAVNSVTGSEVSLPPCPAECPRRPQLHPGVQPPHGSSLAPARQLPPCGRPGWGGGLPSLPAGLSWSAVTRSTSLARWWLYIARRDVCAGNVPALGWGGLRRHGWAAPTAVSKVPKGRMGKQVAGDEAARIWEASGWQQPRLGGSHPAPCPVRQDLSPLPGCHQGG